MRVVKALLADEVQSVNGKTNIIGIGIDNVSAASFPVVMKSLALVAFIQMEDIDVGKEHLLMIKYVGPKEDSTDLVKLNFEAREEHQGKIINLFLGLGPQIYKDFGDYKYVLQCNDEDIFSLDFAVHYKPVIAPSKLVLPGQDGFSRN